MRKLELEVPEQIAGMADQTKQDLALFEDRLGRLSLQHEQLNERLASCQDDVIEKVDVKSLEPLRAADLQLKQQIADLHATISASGAPQEPTAPVSDDQASWVSSEAFEKNKQQTERQLTVLDLGLNRLAQMVKVCLGTCLSHTVVTGDRRPRAWGRDAR